MRARLGAEGVQTPLRSREAGVARQMRELVEKPADTTRAICGCRERQTNSPDSRPTCVWPVKRAPSVARTFFTSGRRYEVFKSIEEFRRFHEQARRTLARIEPVMRKHQIKLAIENHKDHTVEELVSLIREISSEWIGVLVDTGNNIALLEDPRAVVEALAPMALSVHLKDMAVQPYADGFLLSEVPLGTGMLDLPRDHRHPAQGESRHRHESRNGHARSAQDSVPHRWLFRHVSERSPGDASRCRDAEGEGQSSRAAAARGRWQSRSRRCSSRRKPTTAMASAGCGATCAHESAAPLPGIRLFNLEGRSALVSGGSKGLGYAMAAGLASAGANVMLVSRHLDEARKPQPQSRATLAARHSAMPPMSLSRKGRGHGRHGRSVISAKSTSSSTAPASTYGARSAN